MRKQIHKALSSKLVFCFKRGTLDEEYMAFWQTGFGVLSTGVAASQLSVNRKAIAH